MRALVKVTIWIVVAVMIFGPCAAGCRWLRAGLDERWPDRQEVTWP